MLFHWGCRLHRRFILHASQTSVSGDNVSGFCLPTHSGCARLYICEAIHFTHSRKFDNRTTVKSNLRCVQRTHRNNYDQNNCLISNIARFIQVFYILIWIFFWRYFVPQFINVVLSNILEILWYLKWFLNNNYSNTCYISRSDSHFAYRNLTIIN